MPSFQSFNYKALIKKVKFQNFRQFGTVEVNLGPGVTILQGSMGSGKTIFLKLLSFLLTPILPNQTHPSYNLPFVPPPYLSWINSEKLNPDKEQILEMYFSNENNHNHLPFWRDPPDSLKDLFFAKLIIGYRLIIVDKENFEIYLQDQMQSWVLLNDKQLDDWIKLLYDTFWIDHQIFPFFNSSTINQIINFTPVEQFDHFIAWFKLNNAKKRYDSLLNQLNHTNNEIKEFNKKIEGASNISTNLEDQMNQSKRIRELKRKLEIIKEERIWSPILELEQKIQSLEQTQKKLIQENKQIEEMINRLEKEKTDLEESLESEKNTLSRIQSDYEEKRKVYLNYKAQLDQISRKINNWESKIKKTERELKFTHMKVSDKQRRLTEMNHRAKEGSDSNESKNLKENLEDDLKSLEKSHHDTQERLDVFKAEKKRISLEIRRKNSEITPLNEMLVKSEDSKKNADLTVKKIQKNLDSLNKNHDNLVNRVTEINEELNLISQHQIDFNNKLSVSEKIAFDSKIVRPNNIRALSTLDMLIIQINEEIISIQEKGVQENSENLYNEHQLWLSSLGEEISNRTNHYNDLLNTLKEWSHLWNESSKKALQELESQINYFTSSFGLISSLKYSISLLPNEGYTKLLILDKMETNGKIELSSGEQQLVGLSVIVSLFAFQNLSLLIIDDAAINLSDQKLYRFINNLLNNNKIFENTENKMIPQIFISMYECGKNTIDFIIDSPLINIITFLGVNKEDIK
ncbi:MAG: AAA family ATPase [Candidatus Hodarchaeales archaeon]|jgi:chromosome segregation ATPase